MVFVTASMGGGTGTAMGRASGEKRVELEFKQMADYRQELRNYYMAAARYMDIQKIDEGVSRLTDPLDNAINEKCSRIKKTFLELMDEYTASYYIINSHTQKKMAGITRVWYQRLKVITLPRELVINEGDITP